jgi:hypothetical protein
MGTYEGNKKGRGGGNIITLINLHLLYDYFCLFVTFSKLKHKLKLKKLFKYRYYYLCADQSNKCMKQYPLQTCIVPNIYIFLTSIALSSFFIWLNFLFWFQIFYVKFFRKKTLPSTKLQGQLQHMCVQ